MHHIGSHPTAARATVSVFVAPVLGALLLAASVLTAPAPASASVSVSASASVANSWVWPLPAPHVVVRAWQAPVDDYSAGHRGIDIAAIAGSIVVAPESGTVRFAGRVVDRFVLSITHPGGLVSSYEPIETTLEEGDLVARGQQIGTVSAGSHCAESCLHFGVRHNDRYIPPLLLLEARPRAILLPVRARARPGADHGDDAGDRLGHRMPGVTPAGAPAGRSPATSPSSHACRSGLCRGWRARASPELRAGPRRRRAGGLRPCA
jgi:murein DD-endopeptidase MepM/ murein hydrolase activator NlpD